MGNSWIFLVEAGLVFGLILGFAVWELIKLHRDEDDADKPGDD